MSVFGFLSSPQGVPPRKVPAPAPDYRHRDTGTLGDTGFSSYNWSSTTNSPAPGFRHRDTDTLGDTGFSSYNWSSTTNSPAPGYRDGGFFHRYGAFSDGGDYGYSWACTPNSINGMRLNFNSQLLGPNSSFHRGSGIQLRCLSE